MSTGIRAQEEAKYKEECKDKILGILLTKGKATFKELHEALGISKPALTKYIKELEKEGKIEWYRNPEDRRSGFYIPGPNFKSSDSYRQRVVALYLFLPIYKFSKEGSQLIQKYVKEQKLTEEEARRIFIAEFDRLVGQAFLHILLQNLESPKPILTQTFIDLLLYHSEKMGWKLEKYSKLIGEITKEKFGSTKADLEKVLENFEEKDREKIKKVLFLGKHQSA